MLGVAVQGQGILAIKGRRLLQISHIETPKQGALGRHLIVDPRHSHVFRQVGEKPIVHFAARIGCTYRQKFLGDRDSNRIEHSQYALVTSQDLSKHVGERVEIRGKAVTNGDGKLSVESRTKTEVDNGKDQETKTKTEGTSGALDMPFLSVNSMKTLSSSCS